MVKVLSSKKKSAAKTSKPAKKAKPATKTKKTPSRKTEDKKIIPHKAAGNQEPPAKLVLTPLPAEYRGDKIVSMQVTPRRIYVYWEVAEDMLVKYNGSLNLKVLDMKENNFFYAPVSGRIGESFISINPGGDYSVEIGVIDPRGEFVNIIHPESTAVTAAHPEMRADWPRGEIPDCERPETSVQAQEVEPALPEEFFEVPEPVSSY